jgi:hypothetical protein
MKAAIFAFPFFYLGALAYTLHGGPCTAACHELTSTLFWPVSFGGPLVIGFLVAASSRLPAFRIEGQDAESGRTSAMERRTSAMDLDAQLMGTQPE